MLSRGVGGMLLMLIRGGGNVRLLGGRGGHVRHCMYFSRVG